MKIMTQDKTRVLNFKMTYISYVSKNRICEGDFGIAEYASPERAKEVLNDMFQKYAADGSIIIDTRIDTGGVSKGMNAVKAGMARISAQVSKMGDSAKSSFQRQITAITGLYQNYEKQERKVSELKSKLEELSKVRIETEEYKKLKDDIKALEDEFEKVETKQREWLDMGFSIDSAPLQELDKQMDDIWADIDRLQRKQKEMVQKLGEYGVSAEKATQILEQYGAQAGVSSAFVEEMTGKVQALGKGFSESSSTIDTSSITVKESIKGIRSVLYDLSVSSSEYAGTYRGVLEVFNNTSGSAANAQDAFNIVYNALKEAGVPLDELNKKLAQEFPSAAQATKSSVDSSIVEAQKTVSSSTGKMKTDAETNLAGVKKAAEDASGGVNTTTVTNWGNSASEVKKNLDKMKQTANLKLGEMQKTVESHFSGQYNTMTKKWEKACERIGQLITQMVRSTKDSLNGFTRNMNTIGNEMSNNLINGISGAVTGIAGILNEVVSKVNSTISNVNSSLSGIEKAFTFSYDVTTPDGKRRWGKYSMNLPRVNTVPYLAIHFKG